jgi:hypothetical protein
MFQLKRTANMRLIITISVVATGLIALCGATPPTDQAAEWIAEWDMTGCMLPDSHQLDFFRENRNQVEPLLKEALEHKKESVRLRAAFVIESCGPASESLAAMLLRRMPLEKSRLVRIYICNAICVHGPARPETADILLKCWDALDKKAIVPDSEDDSSEASEAVFVAGALSACERNKSLRKKYVTFVLGWLEPPPADMPADKIEAYWDMRWDALAALRSMPRTDDAVPLLKNMLQEKNPKPWLKTQVKATLKAQENKAT